MVIWVKKVKTEKTIEIQLVRLTEVCGKVLSEKYAYKSVIWDSNAPVPTSLASVSRYHSPSSRGNPSIGALARAFFNWPKASCLRSVHLKSIPSVANSYKGAASSVKP